MKKRKPIPNVEGIPRLPKLLHKKDKAKPAPRIKKPKLD